MKYLKLLLLGILLAGVTVGLAFGAFALSTPIFAIPGTQVGVGPFLITLGLALPAFVTGILSAKTILYNIPKEIYEDVSDWMYERSRYKSNSRSYNNYNSYNNESSYSYNKSESSSQKTYSESKKSYDEPKKSSTSKKVNYSYDDMDTNFIGNKINNKSDDLGR